MKNRDRYILKVNEYDMLISMQTNILNISEDSPVCIIDLLTGKVNGCPDEMFGDEPRLAVCSKCIQAWLNKEA